MIRAIRGKKHEKDIILLVNEHQITYEEVAKICVIFAKNEDNIYPPPAKGGQYFIDFLNKCLEKREVTKEILKEFKL